MTGSAREQIELLNQELIDVEQQLSDGEISPDTAGALRARYQEELAMLSGEELPAEERPRGADAARRSGRGLSGRAIAGAAIVGVAIVIIGVFGVSSLTQRGGDGAEGVAGDVLTGEGSVDLSSVTNDEMEEVVAANPDVVGMRLALARRYFEEGAFDKALDHYFEILDREQHPEALANVGWMTYLSGRPDVAVDYLEAALVRQPDYLAAQWFLANIYVSLDRQEQAVPLLVAVASSDGVPTEVRDAAVVLIEQIESGS